MISAFFNVGPTLNSLFNNYIKFFLKYERLVKKGA